MLSDDQSQGLTTAAQYGNALGGGVLRPDPNIDQHIGCVRKAELIGAPIHATQVGITILTLREMSNEGPAQCFHVVRTYADLLPRLVKPFSDPESTSATHRVAKVYISGHNQVRVEMHASDIHGRPCSMRVRYELEGPWWRITGFVSAVNTEWNSFLKREAIREEAEEQERAMAARRTAIERRLLEQT